MRVSIAPAREGTIMKASEIGGTRLSDLEHRAQLHRALVASTVAPRSNGMISCSMAK
jgi:hypothetical protein